LFATKFQVMRNPNIPSLLERGWNSEQDGGWKAHARRWNLAASGLSYLAAMRSTDRSPQNQDPQTTQRLNDQQAGRFRTRCLFQSYQSFKGFSSFAAPPASSIAFRISHSNSCKARISEPMNKPPIRPSTVPAIRPKLLRSIKMKET
jgi:hypothetical protein